MSGGGGEEEESGTRERERYRGGESGRGSENRDTRAAITKHCTVARCGRAGPRIRARMHKTTPHKHFKLIIYSCFQRGSDGVSPSLPPIKLVV